ncbi:MAG TPA: thiamine-phosphate kinase [Thermoanaerobaculia bacterium]|nr:thiamine-phosphate kinase [Thermoanaerobaculia bacterium]
MPLTGEDRLLRWLRGQQGVTLIGNDAAVLPEGGPFAVTVDSQIESVHFVPGLDPALLAKRLLAVNLSDLAAMGAMPRWAFLALSTRDGFDHRRFFRSLIAACRHHGVTLAGGDLARSPGGTVATLTLLGTKPEEGRWLERAHARPGHDLWLGGTVGESAAGRILIDRGARKNGSRIDLPSVFEAPASLARAARRAVRRHLLPEPQLELGLWLGRQPEASALDISDGVARDLHRLCRESSVGAEVVFEALPFARGFEALSQALGADPLELALQGGEDYVLLFTLPSGLAPPQGLGSLIGTITREKKIVLRQGEARRPLPASGWDHLDKSG